MELYKEILIRVLKDEDIVVSFPNLNIDAKEIIKLTCYQTLQEIKSILEDTNLDDKQCFEKIEKIVCLFEDIGSSGGSRHDFG
ncbi:MAG: hypothetical protein IJN48_04555 [Clostridia bacterium]|nr:hypothetical protein [Clostridia bacterium]